MTAKIPQEMPEGIVRPKAPASPPIPPTTEYVGKRELPPLPSERKELLSKIRELNDKYEMAYASALRSFTRVINTHEGLSEEEKKSILYRVWNE